MLTLILLACATTPPPSAPPLSADDVAPAIDTVVRVTTTYADAERVYAAGMCRWTDEGALLAELERHTERLLVDAPAKPIDLRCYAEPEQVPHLKALRGVFTEPGQIARYEGPVGSRTLCFGLEAGAWQRCR